MVRNGRLLDEQVCSFGRAMITMQIPFKEEDYCLQKNIYR